MKHTLILAAALLAAGPAGAALTHAYEFSGSMVTDSAGTANGTLLNGATVSGGMLHLDGIDDSVAFASYLLPTGASPWSVFIRVDGQPNPGTYTEIVSQGFSSGGGFYVGTAPGGNIRLTDHFTATGLAFPGGTSELLLTSGAAGTRFYIGGVLTFSSATPADAVGGGSFTQFGKQFAPFAEYFKGDIDAIRFYDTAILPGDVVEPSAVPEPASWALMIAGFGVGGVLQRRRRREAVVLA